jgi:hypothetical protein
MKFFAWYKNDIFPNIFEANDWETALKIALEFETLNNKLYNLSTKMGV